MASSEHPPPASQPRPLDTISEHAAPDPPSSSRLQVPVSTPAAAAASTHSTSPRVPPIQLAAPTVKSSSSAASAAVAGSAKRSAPMFRRTSSEQELLHLHSRLSRPQPHSDVPLWMGVALGVAIQLTLYGLYRNVTDDKHDSALDTFLSMRWLLHPVRFGGFSAWLVAGIVGACYGALAWSLIVQLLLPVWRLHLKRRTIWPVSCETIQLSAHRAQWANWARGIDKNMDAATVSEEWGAMDGASAIKLMAAYQEQMKDGCEFLVLRFFPTPPPAHHSSWRDYFRRRAGRRGDDGSSPSSSFATPVAATPGTASAAGLTVTSPPGVAQTPFPPITPYPDLAALQTPAAATPFTPGPAGLVGSDGGGLPVHTPMDDTLALVFLTVLPNYDLRPYLPRVVSSALGLLLRPFRRSPASVADANSLWMRLGLIGFQFPFRAGVFFTRPLHVYDGYAQAFRKKVTKPMTTHAAATLQQDEKDAEAREARTARYALVLQVLSDWNVAQSARSRIDLLLHATPSSSSSAVATQRAHMLPLPIPPSYIVDLRAWRGGKWSSYVTALRKEGKRVREAPFEHAGGQASFAADPTLAGKVVDMWRAVARKQAEQGASGPTLLKPNEEWVAALLQGEEEDSTTTSAATMTSSPASQPSSASASACSPSSLPAFSRPLAHILQLRLPQGLAATSVVCSFGPALLTSDVAGFDYGLLEAAERAGGQKVGLYAVKLANVLRKAMAEGVQYVDFGPTTGEAKRQVGCQSVPLYGAAICAQVHLLWLARAAAAAVALGQTSMPSVASVVGMVKAKLLRLPSRAANAVNTAAAAAAEQDAPQEGKAKAGEPAAAATESASGQRKEAAPAAATAGDSAEPGQKKMSQRQMKKLLRMQQQQQAGEGTQQSQPPQQQAQKAPKQPKQPKQQQAAPAESAATVQQKTISEPISAVPAEQKYEDEGVSNVQVTPGVSSKLGGEDDAKQQSHLRKRTKSVSQIAEGAGDGPDGQMEQIKPPTAIATVC